MSFSKLIPSPSPKLSALLRSTATRTPHRRCALPCATPIAPPGLGSAPFSTAGRSFPPLPALCARPRSVRGALHVKIKRFPRGLRSGPSQLGWCSPSPPPSPPGSPAPEEGAAEAIDPVLRCRRRALESWAPEVPMTGRR